MAETARKRPRQGVSENGVSETGVSENPKKHETWYDPDRPRLVLDREAMYETVLRMHESDLDLSFRFRNQGRELELMLRDDDDVSDLTDDEDEDDVCVSLAVANPPAAFRASTGEEECYQKTVTIERWRFGRFTQERAGDIMDAINRAYGYRPCACGQYFVLDGGVTCLFCHMTGTARGRQKSFCPVCQDDGLAMHMTRQPCCGKTLHASCLRRWYASSSTDDDEDEPPVKTCPLCRAPAGAVGSGAVASGAVAGTTTTTADDSEDDSEDDSGPSSSSSV